MMSPLTAVMEEVKAFYSNHTTLCAVICVAAAGGGGGITVHRWLKGRKMKKIRRDYPRDTVILHQLGRGFYAPSIVPFAVKLETYLRMAKIPYQCEFGGEASRKQKWPWISYNGEDMADSAFIMQFLNKRYDLDLSAWMSAEQRAIAVAFQRLAEENLYWVLLVTRWVHDFNADTIRRISLPFSSVFVKVFVQPSLQKMAWAQGIGRHSPEEVRQIGRKDLTALNNYLGKKKFLMGDEPCEEDCAVFGQLSQIYWQLPGSVNAMFTEEFPQLVAYCERMKDTFWPDWLQCTTQGGTVEATR